MCGDVQDCSMYWMFLGWPNASCWRYFAIKRDFRSTSRTIKMNTEVIKNLKKTLTGKASNCTPGSAVVSKPVRLTESFVCKYISECFLHTNYLSKTTKDFNWDLVDSASSHMLVSRTKPCMPQNHCICRNLRMAHYIRRKLPQLFCGFRKTGYLGEMPS